MLRNNFEFNHEFSPVGGLDAAVNVMAWEDPLDDLTASVETDLLQQAN